MSGVSQPAALAHADAKSALEARLIAQARALVPTLRSVKPGIGTTAEII